MLSLLACLLLSTGCITNDDSDKALATWKSTIESGLNQVRTEITTIKAQVAEKASLAQVDEKIRNAPAAAKVDAYTKTETDKHIADAIQALKDSSDAPWQKKTAVNPINPTVPGNVSQVATQAGGTVTMRIYTNPTNALVYPGYTDPVITTPTSYTWFIQFLNSDIAYHKVYLQFNMNLTTLVGGSNNGVIDTTPSTGTRAEWSPNFQTDKKSFGILKNPSDDDVTQTVYFASDGYCVLAPGQVVLVPVIVTLVYKDSAKVSYYTVSFHPNVQAYP